MIKYDKHPNGKLRRNYKDQVSIECTVECIAKENEKYTTDLASKNDSNSRQGSKQSNTRKGLSQQASFKQQSKRLDTPEVLNISVGAAMGETSF